MKCFKALYKNKQFSCFSENIALHKSAWQLHPYEYRNYDASRAVDGLKTNLQATAYQCTISEDNYKTALWRVDLGDILGVHHITIYYRTDNDPWGKRSLNNTENMSLG